VDLQDNQRHNQDLNTRHSFQELKLRLHKKLVARVDLSTLAGLEASFLKEQIREITELLIAEENLMLSSENRQRLITEIQNETLGLGPLEQLLADDHISDILVNTYDQIYVEKFGKLELTGVTFQDDNHLMVIIERILSAVGRRVDEASPMVDARLPDGSRVNAIIPPLALDGPSLSIRKFRTDILSMDDLQRGGSVAGPMIQFLKAAVACRLNVIISGGTGAGKTTLLNILSGYISSGERIVTIEDSAELRLQKPHVVRLETRPPNIEGKGTVSQRDLVRNALRMRPNRIIIGEVRGAEIYDMLQAMNTGHDGSLTTVHANGPRDVLMRMETLMLLSGVDMPVRAIRELISTSIDVVVQINRYSDGKRKVSSVSEIVGMEHDTITMQEVFTFNRTGVGEFGEILGDFEASGIRPHSLARIESSGIHLPPEMFQGRNS